MSSQLGFKMMDILCSSDLLRQVIPLYVVQLAPKIKSNCGKVVSLPFVNRRSSLLFVSLL